MRVSIRYTILAVAAAPLLALSTQLYAADADAISACVREGKRVTETCGKYETKSEQGTNFQVHFNCNGLQGYTEIDVSYRIVPSNEEKNKFGAYKLCTVIERQMMRTYNDKGEVIYAQDSEGKQKMELKKTLYYEFGYGESKHVSTEVYHYSPDHGVEDRLEIKSGFMVCRRPVGSDAEVTCNRDYDGPRVQRPSEEDFGKLLKGEITLDDVPEKADFSNDVKKLETAFR